MHSTKKDYLAAASLCGLIALTGTALAQTVDVKGSTAGETAKTEQGVNADGQHTTAGDSTSMDGGNERASNEAAGKNLIVPKSTPNGGAGNMPALNGDESGVAPRANVQNGTGPEAQAEHSAEATARKTIYDPNNQLGTSLQGRTRPIPGADGGSQDEPASAGTASETSAK